MASPQPMDDQGVPRRSREKHDIEKGPAPKPEEAVKPLNRSDTQDRREAVHERIEKTNQEIALLREQNNDLKVSVSSKVG